MPAETPHEAAQRGSPIRVTAILALAAAVGFVVWLFVRDSDGSSSKPTTSAATVTTPVTRPLLTAATPRMLAAIAAGAKHPVYWAGRRRGVKYELTRTSDGKLYVRYLPKGVRIGDRSGEYLLVGTYPVRNAYRAVQTAAKERGARTFRVPGGGLAVVNDSAPKNVYFAYPHGKYQVEVFDPSPRRARKLVSSGAIRPIH
jgi:hypothetical protein